MNATRLLRLVLLVLLACAPLPAAAAPTAQFWEVGGSATRPAGLSASARGVVPEHRPQLAIDHTGRLVLGAFAVRFHLSTDGVLDAGDVLLGARALGSLAAGAASSTVSLGRAGTETTARADTFALGKNAASSTTISGTPTRITSAYSTRKLVAAAPTATAASITRSE